MRTRSEHSGAAATLRVELELGDLRAEVSAGEVSVVIDGNAASLNMRLTGDAAVALANQLTDAVDEMDGRAQR